MKCIDQVINHSFCIYILFELFRNREMKLPQCVNSQTVHFIMRFKDIVPAAGEIYSPDLCKGFYLCIFFYSEVIWRPKTH